MRGDRRWFDRVATAGTVAGLSDRELLRRFAARGEDRAFEALVARHGPMVLGVCRRLLDDDHAADDAFQATWLVLVRRAGSLRDGDRLGPWLHGVARRVALRARQIAARRRAVEHVGLTADPQAAPGPDDDRAERQGALDEEVARMPERLRSPLILCYLEGLTHEEAAHRLGCPLGTVRSRIARSRAMLRDRLARRGWLAPEVGLIIPSPVLCPPVPEVLFDATCRAGVGVASGAPFTAAGVSTLVAALTTEAVRMLQITRWKARLVTLTLLATSAGGAWMAASHGRDQPPGPIAVAVPDLAEDPAPAPAPAEDPTDFHGVVVDPEGKPIAGVTVFYGSTDKGQTGHKEVRTSPDGTFTCRRPPGSKSLAMVIHHEGFQVLSYSDYLDLTRKPDGPITLKLRKVEPFVATLVDEQGQPMAGATVRVLMSAFAQSANGPTVVPGLSGQRISTIYSYLPESVIAGSELKSLFTTTTDATGSFRFRAIGGEGTGLKLLIRGPNGQAMRVRAGAPVAGSVRQTLENQGFATTVPGKPSSLVAIPAARIEGRVVSRLPGQVLSGLDALYQQSREPGRSKPTGNLGDRVPIGPDGRFVFDGLASGAVNVFVEGEGENRDWTYRAAESVALEPGRVAAVTIELIRGVEVTGTVVARGSGRAVEGVQLGVYGPFRPRTGAMTTSSKTDAQGRFAYRLPPGETYFYVMAPVAGFRHDPGSPASRTVAIPDGATSFQVPPIELEPAGPPPN